MTAPLLNEYKIRLALKRLFSTATGCLLFGASKSTLHCVVLHSLQCTLFIAPFISSGLCYLILGKVYEWGSIANILLGGTRPFTKTNSKLMSSVASLSWLICRNNSRNHGIFSHSKGPSNSKKGGRFLSSPTNPVAGRFGWWVGSPRRVGTGLGLYRVHLHPFHRSSKGAIDLD